MSLEHIILPFLIIGFSFSAIHSLKLGLTFIQTGRRVPAVVTGRKSDGLRKSGVTRPIVTVVDTRQAYIVRDINALCMKEGEVIEVYISEKHNFAYRHIGYLFWCYPLILTLIVVALSAAYVAIL
jgi:hypothetical protein